MYKINSGYDWNQFVCACRENVKKRAPFKISQDGEKIDAYFVVKKSGDGLGFYNSKTGKKAANELGDSPNGYLEQLAGPVGNFSFPFFIEDAEGLNREWIIRNYEL